MPTCKLLIVDDDPAQMKILCDNLEPAGYATSCFTGTAAALAALRKQTFDLILTDLKMPGMDGIAFLRAAREIDADLVGIIMVGPEAIGNEGQEMEAAALDYIVKPFALVAILPVLTRALAVRRLRLENVHLQQAVGLYELSMVIQLTLGFDAVLKRVADAAMGHNHVGGVSMLVPVEGGKALRIAVSRGDNSLRDEGKRILFTPELSNWSERSLKRVFRLNELADIEASLPLTLPELPGSTSVAMLSGGRFVGILNFTPRNPGRPISPEQIKAMNILAGAAASALQSASLLDQLGCAEHRYRSLSEHAADLIIRYELQPKPHVGYVNPAFAAIMGYSAQEFYADPALILATIHPEDRLVAESVLRGDFVNGCAVILRCVNRDGHTVWIEQRNSRLEDSEGRLVAIEGIARDITERRNLEEQLRQAQKMEEIGHLAGGLAHDFNNMLTVIIGYSDLILSDHAPSGPIAEKVGQVKKAAELAAALTRQLLSLGRKHVARRRVLDVNAIVEHSSKMFRRIVGEDIQLLVAPDAGLWPTTADPGQIEQILMNLVVNGKASMPLGGKMTIGTKNVILDEQRGAGAPGVAPGQYIMFSVTDTGCGMSPSTMARIFEPFYTTKEEGMGTGLGLAVVHGIVKQSMGDIRVFSEPGQGTRFEILLPRSPKTADGVVPHISHAALAMPSEVRAGSGTILVVEDDAALGQLIGTVLHNKGYGVRIARDGDEALHICQQQEGRIGLVLTDVIMPGMSGPAMVDSLKQLDHRLKVLYMSGFARDAVTADRGLDPDIRFIQKPFTPVELVCKVWEVLATA